MISSVVIGANLAAGTTPIWSAKASHVTLPIAIPAGTPTIKAARISTVAWQATVARTWLRTKPSVLRIAMSPRLRLTLLATV